MATKNEIRLYGPIGSYPSFSAEEVAQSIPPGAKEATVRINSPGGSLAEGLAIYNYLRDHPATITTIVDGVAASAASIVMLAGDIRQVHTGSVVMVHNPWTSAIGNADELRQTAETLDEFGEAMIGIYTSRTGQSEETIRNLLKNETYMRGSTALKMGFADELYDSPEQAKIAAMASPICDTAKEYIMADKKQKQAEDMVEPVAVVEPIDQPGEVEATDTKDATILALTEEVTAAVANRNSAIELHSKLQSEFDAQATALADITAERDSQAELIASITVERDTAVNALANPQMIDAAMIPAVGAEAEQTDAEIDALEAAAAAKVKTFDTITEQYQAMEPGPERTAFLKANRNAIYNGE